MEKENNKKTINERVISEIEKKGIKMKPKLYFMAKSFLLFGLLFLFSLFALYIGSLIVFIIRANNILCFHGMGFHAFRSIVLSFPWYLVFLAAVLIVLIEIASKRFRIVYQKPLIFSLLAIIVLTLIGSFLVERSSVHQHFYNLAQQEKPIPMGRMYRNLGNLDIENAYYGKVLGRENEQWAMELGSGEVVSLKIGRETRGRRIYLEALEEGDRILIVGEKENGLIDVFAFRRINDRPRINER